MTGSNAVRHGELVAALLNMRACDATRAAAAAWVPVDIRSFFRDRVRWEEFLEIFVLKNPSRYSTAKTKKKTFAATFEGYGIWFNHVI